MDARACVIRLLVHGFQIGGQASKEVTVGWVTAKDLAKACDCCPVFSGLENQIRSRGNALAKPVCSTVAQNGPRCMCSMTGVYVNRAIIDDSLETTASRTRPVKDCRDSAGWNIGVRCGCCPAAKTCI